VPSDVPIPNIPDLFRVAIDYEIGGLLCTNVYHVFQEGGGGADAAATVGQSWADNIGGIISETVDWVQSRAQELVPNTLEYVYNLSAYGTGSGDASGGAVPPGVAMCIKLLTAFGGRRGRGRTFIAGCPVSGQESADFGWTDGFVTSAESAMDDFMNALSSGNWPLVVFSRGSIEHEHEPMYNAVTGNVANKRFTSQRRRNYN
jgi:hypothetical protein